MIRGNDDDLFNIFILSLDRTLPLNSVAIGYTGAGYKPLVALSAIYAPKLARAHAPPPPPRRTRRSADENVPQCSVFLAITLGFPKEL